jgi:hypothetical protein
LIAGMHIKQAQRHTHPVPTASDRAVHQEIDAECAPHCCLIAMVAHKACNLLGIDDGCLKKSRQPRGNFVREACSKRRLGVLQPIASHRQNADAPPVLPRMFAARRRPIDGRHVGRAQSS